MTERRRFEVVAPDWGEAHLTPEAVVAYVDGELAPGPHERATRHLGHCADCTSDVALQRQASTALRGADCPTLPSSLMSSLRAIPQSADLPPCVPAGLSLGPDGEFVAVLRDGTGRRASRRSRRMRIGAGAAFSGLAIGALAFGASGSAATPTPGTPGLDPGGAVARFATTPVPDRPAPPSRPTMLNANLPPQDR